MSVVVTTSPAPGWYPDPNDAETLRWWDGSGWTEFTAGLPDPEPEPSPDPPARAPAPDVAPERSNGFFGPLPTVEFEPIEYEPGPFARSAPMVAEPVEPEPAVQVEVAPRPFAFRTRPMEIEPAVEVEAGSVVSLPVYASPLNLIKSPVAPRVVVAPDEPPVTAPEPPATVPEPPAPEPEPAAVAEPLEVSAPAAAPAEVEAPRRLRRPSRRAAAGTAAVVVVAAGGAGATNLLHGEDPAATAGAKPPKPAPFAGAVAGKSCLKEWNTATSGGAAQLRVTLGQFSGALARVQRVSPLPGTLMGPDSCGLTVYDPASDAHGVFVSGVKKQVGYLDVTAYPRAKRYGWPTTDSQANVVIREDGSLRAR